MNEAKKAIIIADSLENNYFPLLKILRKELLPLADRPIIDFIVSEAMDSEIEKIIFVLPLTFFSEKKVRGLKEFFEISKEEKQEEERFKNVSFSYIFQHLFKGDGSAIMKARNYIKNENFAVLSPNDVFDSKIPCLSQLKRIFETANKPIVALKKIPNAQFFSGTLVSAEKISNNLYKIKEIENAKDIEERQQKNIKRDKCAGKNFPVNKFSSDLAITGRYVLTPEIWKYLKTGLSNNAEARKATKQEEKISIIKRREIPLSGTNADNIGLAPSIPQILNAMIKDGKMVYGYETSGEWLNCDKQIDWLKANLYFSLKHPKYGSALRAFLKEHGLF